ncbi:MAG TPA: hypothetical protein VF166_06050 [Gemmatimonadaceae bacterium]
MFGATGAAALYLADNAWFGAGDLWAMLFWSVPFGVLLAIVIGPLSRRLAAAATLWRYGALVPLAGVLGYLWTVIVALVLGGWIGAFSFPVLFCWVAGGLLGGVVAAWSGRPRSWPAALVLGATIALALGQLNAHARAPQPRMRVIVTPGATAAEVQRVWTEVLGRPTGPSGAHDLLPGISSVSASGYEGESAVLTVSFWKSTSKRQRDSLVALIRRSPLVARVDSVTPEDTSGVRPSVSY